MTARLIPPVRALARYCVICGADAGSERLTRQGLCPDCLAARLREAYRLREEARRSRRTEEEKPDDALR